MVRVPRRRSLLSLFVGVVFGCCIISLINQSHQLFYQNNVISTDNQKILANESETNWHQDPILVVPEEKGGDLYKKVRVLCWILTTPANHDTRAKAVKETWGKRCNVLLFMSSANDSTLPSVELAVREGRNGLWGKTREAFRYAWDRYQDEVDWFLKADDDTYVIVENLRYFLSAFNTSKPLWFGHKFKAIVKSGYFSGGAGYVLSREATRRFVKEGYFNALLCRHDHEGAEDAEMGKCMEKLNVSTMDSRDSKGRGRFHPFVPNSVYFPGNITESYWYWKNIYYPPTKERDCCSDSTISFHYVDTKMMYLLDMFLYQIRPFGMMEQSCLHVLCENCLKDLLAVDNEDGCENVIYSGRSKPHKAFIVCPLCKQETAAGERGLSSLHLDPVYQKKTASDSCLSGLICTSCKANEEAVAKCMDCDNLLCPNCYSAHKYMRCFDNHSVITFEELSQSGQSVPIRRNPNCPRHPTESFKYFCNTCQVATCTQCLNTFHLALEHRTERLTDAEARCRAELTQFSEEISVRQNTCRINANKLEKMLGELQHQHDAAKSAISEVHEAYVALLEKKREQMLEELEALHSKQELSIMEACQRVDRTRDRIQTALRYTKMLLGEAEPAGLLHLSASIKAQMQLLHNAASRNDEVDVLLKFESNLSRFEDALNGSYGYFAQHGSSGVNSSGVPSKPVSSLGLPTPSSTPLPPSPSHSSPLETQPPPSGNLSNIGYGMSSGMLKNDLTHSVLLSSMADMTNAPPDLSAALSLSSFANSMSSSSSSPSMRALDLNSLGSVGSMTSIQEYNLQQLASLAGKAESQNPIQQHHHLQQHQRQQAGLPPPRGTPSPHPTSPFTLADLLAGDMNVTSHAFTNLQALAKLGSHKGSLGMDALGGASHGVSPLSSSGMQSLGTNLGLLVNGSGSSVSHNGGLGGPPLSPHDASLLASALSAPPFIPSNSPRPSSAVSASSSASYTAGNSSGTLASNPKYIPMQTRVRFGQLGSAKGQFNSPHGFCLGIDEDIVVADTNNHRIQIFDKDGLFKHDFGNPGKEEGQLWYPRKVAVIRQSGKIVVCDRGNERSRMQIFSRTGQFIKRIVIRYIDIVAGLAINEQGHIVAVDSVSPTVFRITENGELIKWFDVSDRMREPSDLAIHGKEYYICDFKGHCVVVFNEEGDYVRRIGCESITNFPNGIDISDAGDVLIGDSHGNRFHVAVFSRSGSLLSEFECPHVKVSRCCGLKITSEGFVVTLAKNNHYVLVLNTLYIV